MLVSLTDELEEVTLAGRRAWMLATDMQEEWAQRTDHCVCSHQMWERRKLASRSHLRVEAFGLLTARQHEQLEVEAARIGAL